MTRRMIIPSYGCSTVSEAEADVRSVLILSRPASTRVKCAHRPTTTHLH